MNEEPEANDAANESLGAMCAHCSSSPVVPLVHSSATVIQIQADETIVLVTLAAHLFVVVFAVVFYFRSLRHRRGAR